MNRLPELDPDERRVALDVVEDALSTAKRDDALRSFGNGRYAAANFKIRVLEKIREALR